MKIDKRFVQEFAAVTMAKEEEKIDWIPWTLDRIAVSTLIFLVLALGAAIQHYFPATATIFFICSGVCAAITTISYVLILIAMADDVEDD